VKLGAGGIREIEFTVQVLELIWGGRDPALRDPTTLGALAALAAAGKLDRRAAADLADAYVFLRTTEHRLQMVADRQTHRLPEAPEELARIASFMGYESTEAFAEALTAHQRRVQGHYARLFEAAPQLSSSGDSGNLVFTGVDDDPETMATLRGMGFRDPGSVAAMVRSWHHGRPRAMRSERARELLTELMPALLAAFARQREPDAALVRFDMLLQRLAAGVQWLSLLHRNPRLLVRLAGLLGAAPQLADHIARRPAALEGLLAGSYAAPGEKPLFALPALMREARDVEEALDATRRLVTEHMFEVDVAELEGRMDADSSGEARSAIADAAIDGPAAGGPERLRPALRQGAGRRARRAGARQARRAGDAAWFGPRSHLHLRPRSRGRGERGRRAVPGAVRLLHPPVAPGGGGADHARRPGQRLRGGHAAPALGQQGPGGDAAVLLRALPRRGGLDLGAHGADPGARGGRAGRRWRGRSRRRWMPR
jgi:hypothetical protein